MADIIPPGLTQGEPIVVSYMGPYREKNGEHRLVLSVISQATGRMIAHGDLIVASRDSGVALGEAIKAVVVKEVPPPIHQGN